MLETTSSDSLLLPLDKPFAYHQASYAKTIMASSLNIHIMSIIGNDSIMNIWKFQFNLIKIVLFTITYINIFFMLDTDKRRNTLFQVGFWMALTVNI